MTSTGGSDSVSTMDINTYIDTTGTIRAGLQIEAKKSDGAGGKVFIGAGEAIVELNGGLAKLYGDGGIKAKSVYFGDYATDGTWRFEQSGNNLILSRRESGTYTTKYTFTPTP